MIGVYEIYNITLDKKYIGSSLNVEKRLSDHQKNLELGRHIKKEIQNDYNNSCLFRFTILKELKSSCELESWENYYIGRHNSIESGYNSTLARRSRKALIKTKYVYKNFIPNLIDKKSLIMLLNLTEKEFLFLEECGLPTIKITKYTKRYDITEVTNWFMKRIPESEIARLQKGE